MQRSAVSTACAWVLANVLVVAAGAPVVAQNADSPAPPSAADGGKLYKRYCRGCHGEDGRGGAHTFMPHIGTLSKKGYIDLLPDTYLYTVIAEGGEAVGKNSYMPAWKNTLSEQQIMNIIAYIRTMPTY